MSPQWAGQRHFVYDTEQTRAKIVCVYNNTDSICMQQHIHVIMGMDVKYRRGQNEGEVNFLFIVERILLYISIY